MKDKKSIAKRLMTIYVTFILVILLAITGQLSPDFKKGFEAGDMLRSTIEASDTEHSNIFMLTPVNLIPFENAIPITVGDSLVTVTGYCDRATLIAKIQGEGQVSGLAFYGDSPIYYASSMLIVLVFIWMLVLIAKIMLSLRRSIKEERAVDKKNVTRVRFIGAILIVSELASALLGRGINLRAAEVLSGSGLSVDTSYSPDLLIVMLGILILFMGELFSLSHTLSEEQKFTI